MLPASANLDIYRGDTGRWQFKLWTDTNRTQAADLTGVTVAATIRSGASAVLMACTVTLPNIIDMVLTPDQSRNLPTVGNWDLQLTYLSGDIFTVMRGSAIVTQDVTYSGTGISLARAR